MIDKTAGILKLHFSAIEYSDRGYPKELLYRLERDTDLRRCDPADWRVGIVSSYPPAQVGFEEEFKQCEGGYLLYADDFWLRTVDRKRLLVDLITSAFADGVQVIDSATVKTLVAHNETISE